MRSPRRENDDFCGRQPEQAPGHWPQGVDWVKCHYDSIHGRIVSKWKMDAGQVQMDVTIPPNTTATVYVPAKDSKSVTESGKQAAKAEDVKFLRMEKDRAVYEVDSGCYSFCGNTRNNANHPEAQH
ncbi:MAG: alpha-L-rhamnosidase C-terminal domain-containing protein [Verrucomicrobiota bacterium]